jgi:hypothetical protein
MVLTSRSAGSVEKSMMQALRLARFGPSMGFPASAWPEARVEPFPAGDVTEREGTANHGEGVMLMRISARMAALLLLVGLLVGAIPAQAADDPTYLTTTPNGPPGTQPRTDGTTIVWQIHESQVQESPRDVYAANLNDRQVVPVATGPTD